MKKYWIIIFIVSLQLSTKGATGSQLQTTTEYQVILVNGDIRKKHNQEILVFKSKFWSNERLSFSTLEDYLILLDSRKVLFHVTPQKGLVDYDFKPIDAAYGTKPGKLLLPIDIKNLFDKGPFLILDEELKLEISSSLFPMNEDNFFFLQYDWSGDSEVVNKKLSWDRNYLILSKKEIYRVNGNPILPETTSNIKLHYYKAVEKEMIFLSDVILVFPNEPKLKKEIQFLIDQLEGQDLEKTKRTIKNFLFQEYGVPEKGNLADWLKDNFQID